MNKEIKEILNGLNVVIKHGGSVEINSKECKKIIDYITNLQNENIFLRSHQKLDETFFKWNLEDLIKERNEIKKENEELIEEIKKLQDNFIRTYNLRMYYEAKYKELKEVKK